MVGNAVLGPPAFLVAVSGLLVPRPPQPQPQPPRRHVPPVVRNAALRGSNGSDGYGGFDAGAWKDIASPSPAAATAAPTATASSKPAVSQSSSENSSAVLHQHPGDDEQERERGAEVIDVDVEKLPTFAFFGRTGDGRHWREDVVGGGNARACAAELQNKMDRYSSLGGTWTPDDSSTSLPSGGGGGGRGADVVGGGGIPSGDRVENAADTGVGRARSGGAGTANANNSNIVEVFSKNDLLRILGTRKKGQGPVVVMYHAPWCRKCAYLTPVFRRLAAARMAGAEEILATADGANCGCSNTASPEPVFCRADVSNPSWGRERPSTAFAEEEVDTELLHSGSPGLENCDVCGGSGFVPCGECEGKGAVARSSPDGKHTLAVTCPACVGYKRLRCPSCGGKCYMCD